MVSPVMTDEERIEQLKLDIYNTSFFITHYVERENWERVNFMMDLLKVLLQERESITLGN